MISLSCICFIQQVYPQSSSSDSSFHPYHINYWGTGTILGIGSLANYRWNTNVRRKTEIVSLGNQELNRGDIHGIDTWSLKQDPSIGLPSLNYSNYAPVVHSGSSRFPLLFVDHRIRRDWFDMLLDVLKTIRIGRRTFYELELCLGPNFQDRMRPITYYDQVSLQREKAIR